MDIFEYLPQLIIAYDGNDEFANLIHVKKADKDNNYFCPCCGGTVKPRALDSTKEQSHYYHITGKCTKESQLHFFCKNWLFEKGSKFYIDDNLFEVDSIDIEKIWNTQFGDYKPDITVYTTSGEIIYFEMFFSNRKTGDDYFCKWNALGNDVGEVNIKEYMVKTDEKVIPTFKYLYHDGVCYSKTYEKKDLYANTIARIKREFTRQKVFNYKARIEQLDWFWKSIQSNDTRESILEILSAMDYEDLLSCYEIIKRKQCVLYLKNDVINMINQKVLEKVRKTLDLPYDENVYFDLKHIRGRTYEAGIRLNLQTEHIIYDDFYIKCYSYYFDKLKEYPKIIFSKNIFDTNEIIIPDESVEKLKEKFDETVKFKEELIKYESMISNFEGNDYKIRMNNNVYTILGKIHSNQFEIILDNFYMRELDIKKLSTQIEFSMKGMRTKEYLNTILNDSTYLSLIYELKSYKDMDYHVNLEYQEDRCYKEEPYCEPHIHFILYIGNKIIYDEILELNFEDFIIKINECKNILDDIGKTHSIIITLIDKINKCKNDFWEAKILFNYNGHIEAKIDQKIFKVIKSHLQTSEIIYFKNFELLTRKDIIRRIEYAMHNVLKNMERCGYRVMEERI